MLFAVLKYFLIFALLVLVAGFCLDRLFRAEGYKGPASDHFDGTKFSNIGPVPVDPAGDDEGEGRGRLAMIKWLVSRDSDPWTDREFSQTKPAERVMGADIVATFINHATVLVQTEGKNIITDPVYERRASPVQWIGPARHANPGVAFDDLPPIDLVLLSHNHYDHMDLDTLRRLQDKFHPTILAPLGNAAFLAENGIEGAIDLDWWQSYDGVTLVPSQHFSARAISDRNKTLWGGYVVPTSKGDVYFAGDTGYGPFVQEIAARYPKGFRFGILPIGAYEPRWIMSEVHVSPDEAVRMKDELGVREALAIHFGTFKLAGDRQDQPTERLAELSGSAQSPASPFRALENGQSIIVTGTITR